MRSRPPCRSLGVRDPNERIESGSFNDVGWVKTSNEKTK